MPASLLWAEQTVEPALPSPAKGSVFLLSRQDCLVGVAAEMVDDQQEGGQHPHKENADEIAEESSHRASFSLIRHARRILNPAIVSLLRQFLHNGHYGVEVLLSHVVCFEMRRPFFANPRVSFSQLRIA